MLLTRRTFLKAVVVSTGTVITGCGGSGSSSSFSAPEEIIPIEPAFFPQSVASGDPKTESIILWSRVLDPQLLGNHLSVRIQVSAETQFKQKIVDIPLAAQPEFDYCVKVKVVGLAPYTRYYYRFIYVKGSSRFSSPIGRTKTAPLPDAEVPIKFSFVSGQEYSGRYDNAYFKLLDEDPDFFVHLGDYIDETTLASSLQVTDAQRAIYYFEDGAGAIPLTQGETTFYAAASLDNYRQLYRTFRRDVLLQQIHQLFPMVAIWNDHEFSDDCWGATATYTQGRQIEFSEERRRNAEQAWSEYMPVDLGEAPGVMVPDLASLFPHHRIYRDFRFGRHLHLIMTDYRSYRPDHLIPEDAFMGTLAIDDDHLKILLQDPDFDPQRLKDVLVPYFNIDDPEYAFYKPILIGAVTETYRQAGANTVEATQKALNVVQGALDAQVVNQLLDAYNVTVTPAQRVPLLTAQQLAGMKQGLSFSGMGKQKSLSALGSRYMVIKNSFDAWATYKFLVDGNLVQNAWGQIQETWFRTTLMNSTATWKIVGSSTSLTSLQIDLSNTGLLPQDIRPLIDALPPGLRHRFYLNVDQWDGFKDQRKELLNFMDTVPNTLIISGDAHALCVAQHGQRTYEFTGTSIASDVLKEEVSKRVQEMNMPQHELLTAHLETLLQIANLNLHYVNAAMNGIGTLRIDGNEAQLVYSLLPVKETLSSYYDQRVPLQDKFETISFNVKAV